MPIYTIPADAGPFVVVRSDDGSWAVANEPVDPMHRVLIPCRDEPQALDIRDRLNRGEHDGTIQINLLPPMPERA